MTKKNKGTVVMNWEQWLGVELDHIEGALSDAEDRVQELEEYRRRLKDSIDEVASIIENFEALEA